MSEHRHPPSNVSHDVHADNFECMEALHAFRLEAVQLEALAHAAGEAVVQLPFPPGHEKRRTFDRVYALVTKVAEAATALVTYGNELIAEREKQSAASSKEHHGSHE